MLRYYDSRFAKMMITMNDTTRNRFYKSQEDMYEQGIENGSICFKGTGKECQTACI